MSLVGSTAFAVGALVVSSGLAAWVVGIDPTAWLHEPALANTSAALTFDDRFGSRSTLSASSIYYPSRRGIRSDRDFKAEFDQIEDALAGQQLRETQIDLPSEQAAVELPPPSAPAVASVPMPRSRPAEANVIARNDAPPSPAAPVQQADNRTFFQKIADMMPARMQLASLDPNDGLLAGPSPNLGALGYDSTTAVYDITGRIVYMPDGTKFEAHSGLGNLLDDPAHVNARNAGATPPGIYEMKPREKLFHGVPALRMTPVDGSETFGRVGLLVHPYMLGPNGDSNGCISVKHYERFLQAYRNGAVKRIAVVVSIKDTQSASSRAPSNS
ncbi:hypothetical protein AS156_19930 [Bradyrhizobium macuxiense]|uniref:Tlde1 domain-containing protein n=1 Tax=Bradyrhizobium macuxiense TaxID=1755647 RepID=A0A109JDZ2_9BRAD|nr:DUF2778 domain-containing protein [Bradyrhizobium macuxiense]KWV47140.1 hypothetical protein AS156_19930 [Bradyrhizobium macuxiense]